MERKEKWDRWQTRDSTQWFVNRLFFCCVVSTFISINLCTYVYSWFDMWAGDISNYTAPLRTSLYLNLSEYSSQHFKHIQLQNFGRHQRLMVNQLAEEQEKSPPPAGSRLYIYRFHCCSICSLSILDSDRREKSWCDWRHRHQLSICLQYVTYITRIHLREFCCFTKSTRSQSHHDSAHVWRATSFP